jgi:hypothetical protein
MAISRGIPISEGGFRYFTDIEARRHWEQTGLDNPVVFAVNYEYYGLSTGVGWGTMSCRK